MVTALGNDVGFELIFKRQIIAHARDRDIAIALSTSGNSEDLMTAITEAKQRGLLTIGFSGHDGGRMAAADDLDFCFTVHSQSIHRIQESHAMLGYRLWSVAQEHMARPLSRSARAMSTHCAATAKTVCWNASTSSGSARPRLLDDVVTLAHGAGGKSSAALVDAVFLEAFRNDELEQLGDAAALRTPRVNGSHFPPTRMSFRRGAFRADPSATSRCMERSTTSRCRARVHSGCRRRS